MLVEVVEDARLGRLVLFGRDGTGDGAASAEGAAAEALADVAAAAACELRWRRGEAARKDAERALDTLLRMERSARGEAQAAERRSAFLADVGTILDASLDYHDTFQKLARLVVPALADYCLIDEALPDGGLRRIARAHVDPHKERTALYATLYHPPTEETGHHPVLQVIRTGEPVLVPDVTRDTLEGIAHDDDHRRRLAVLALRSYIMAPLVARGRVLGAITLVSAVESERRYDAADLSLALEVARRAAVAIDNARLYTQAQSAIRARDAVLAVVSHDLRNPLSSILLSATMVLDMAPGDGLEPWVAENIRQVVGSVEQTNRLIEDLLDVARLENGRLSLDRAPVDARALVATAARMLAPIAQARGVALEVGGGGGPLPVLADADRVVQVLSNLIGNAVKFTSAGGVVRVGLEEDGGEPRFVVADDGAGIAEEHLPHVFDRFWQVGRADRRGVGLGLPIARGIVEAHGGRIWIESRPGAGTVVRFTIPSVDGKGSA
ncbi:MAG TPA: GAF domain-containing sensor histidine kinase [Longimicrobium sp.]|nr:GAF domain-containing sensor histidine kinase [Longimicrobium sp.]